MEQRLEAVTVEKNTLERRVAALTQEKLALRLGLEAALSYVDRFLEGRAPEGWTRAESQEIERLRALAQGKTLPAAAGTGQSVAAILEPDGAASTRRQ